MPDTYEPPRIEERTEIGPNLIGGIALLSTNVDGSSAAFRPL
jgi:hypothetical protein